MRIIKEKTSVEYVIQKSRFIATAFPISSVIETSEGLSLVKKKYYDATHHCYAFTFGENGEIVRSNDDGEPSGTAGLPILETLRKKKITNTMVIVTRYFGGIKLGAGGLTRAYGKSASLVLESAEYIEKKAYQTYRINLTYKESDVVLPFLQKETIVQKITYLDTVTITFAIKEESIKNVLNNMLKRTLSYQDSGVVIFDEPSFD